MWGQTITKMKTTMKEEKDTCRSVHPVTGKKCSQPEGHVENGHLKSHIDAGRPVDGGVLGNQGMVYVTWKDEGNKQ